MVCIASSDGVSFRDRGSLDHSSVIAPRGFGAGGIIGGDSSEWKIMTAVSLRYVLSSVVCRAHTVIVPGASDETHAMALPPLAVVSLIMPDAVSVLLLYSTPDVTSNSTSVPHATGLSVPFSEYVRCIVSSYAYSRMSSGFGDLRCGSGP